MATPIATLPSLDKKVSLGDVPFSLPFQDSDIASTEVGRTIIKRLNNRESVDENKPADTADTTTTVSSRRRSWREEMKKLSKFAATWLTLPQITVKTVQLVFAVITLVLLFAWESEGINVTTLDQGEYNYRNRIYCYVGVACITILYAVVMPMLGLAGVKIPSKALLFFSAFMLMLWLVVSPIMSATLDLLNDSIFARKNDLNILMLKIAVIFGFLQLVMFVSDVLLGFTALRKSSGTKSSKAFEVELKHSKSVLAAAKISARNSRRKLSESQN